MDFILPWYFLSWGENNLRPNPFHGSSCMKLQEKKSLSLFSLSSEIETHFYSLIYKWYQKMAPIFWHKHKAKCCFNCFENLWIKFYSDNAKLKSTRTEFSWEKERKRNKTYDQNRGSRGRPAVIDRNLVPRFKAEWVLWMTQGVIIVLTFGSIFELAAVIGLHLLSAYDSQVHLRERWKKGLHLWKS